MMSKKDLDLKLKELTTDHSVIRNLEISIGRIYEEAWTDTIDPTPAGGDRGARDQPAPLHLHRPVRAQLTQSLDTGHNNMKNYSRSLTGACIGK